MKHCRVCKRPKPPEAFKKSSNFSDGRDTICKKCYSSRNRVYNKIWRSSPRGAISVAWSNLNYRVKHNVHNCYEHVQIKMTKTEFNAWALPRFIAWIKTHSTWPTIDRRKSSGHYEITNIRLATLEQNSANTRCTVLQLAAGVAARCLKHGINPNDVAVKLLQLSKINKKPAQDKPERV